ncbi:plant UBX domain-containing protein 1 isoform X1 [Syzygium oleosum]|uniref:plant UBX domain-containing protein 1 isoform X1 n=1 Tax=Syzygium oleosum TaxID=219896 RepID=UPI0024B9AD71|nr:plant UBX domain-containing protein 1 isoform X1 [Syzygium oleosum]XP_030450344.2 plant UBX domain-containing protein 1 isoform X1 [Syzygium oleosum]XP_056169703.1 plant UBX domain-containing protein 1 isoform X1 [Syzygium oleosum]
MIVDGSSSHLLLKRRRLAIPDPMEAEPAKAKLAEINEKFGREIRVFETSASSLTENVAPGTDETDDFYEFTAEDYHRLLTTKKEEKHLKTRKLREAEEAARRSRITKTTIRVRFPDNHTLEATFHPSEKIESLVALLEKVVAKPEMPFYIYTTPPKKQIKDLSQDFYSAGFIPGAIVYFSYDAQKVSNEDIAAAEMSPFLQEYVVALKDWEHNIEMAEPVQSAPASVEPAPPPVVQDRKPADKKPVKPKWLKM